MIKVVTGLVALLMVWKKEVYVHVMWIMFYKKGCQIMYIFSVYLISRPDF